MAKLTELLGVLPAARRPTLQPSAHAAITQPAEYKGFVAPPLRVPGGDKILSDRPIVLISAPGAVGKSALARHLAANHATALWDLSKLALGDNTFLGTLASAFGASQLGAILNDLTHGRALFVFDAFDEAELLSGWDRVEGFVQELWNYVANSTQVSAILLARTETATFLDVMLSELSPEHRRHIMVEIDFFDHSGAARFVERQLEEVYERDTHLQHPEPFRLALQGTFDVLSQTLGCDSGEPWSMPHCRSFLGYAPVLQAIAAHLSEYTNYHETLAEISNVGAIGDENALLPALMRSLTRREQVKFVEPLRERSRPSGTDLPDWDELYGETEQLRRIFYVVADLSDAKIPPDVLPTWLRDAYQEGLQAFLPNHPFLRGKDFAGPAFRDYVYAALLADREIGPLVEAWLEGIPFVPTPLFAEFYHVACGGTGAGTHAGYLYESIVGRFGLEHAALTAMVNPEMEEGSHSFAIVSDEPEATDPTFSIALTVDDSSPLTFRLRLRSAVLKVRGPVILGAPVQFELGDVELQAESLDIRTPTLSVRTYHGQQSVAIQTDSTISHDPRLKIEIKPGAELRVSWPGANKYPWSAYADDNLFAEKPDRHGALLALRRILVWFRKEDHWHPNLNLVGRSFHPKEHHLPHTEDCWQCG